MIRLLPLLISFSIRPIEIKECNVEEDLRNGIGATPSSAWRKPKSLERPLLPD